MKCLIYMKEIACMNIWKHFIYHFTSFLHGLIRTHKWPAPNVSGFIAQLVRASHRYREVTGSNPVEVLTFSGFCSQLLKLRSKLRWSWLTWKIDWLTTWPDFKLGLNQVKENGITARQWSLRMSYILVTKLIRLLVTILRLSYLVCILQCCDFEAQRCIKYREWKIYICMFKM